MDLLLLAKFLACLLFFAHPLHRFSKVELVMNAKKICKCVASFKQNFIVLFVEYIREKENIFPSSSHCNTGSNWGIVIRSMLPNTDWIMSPGKFKRGQAATLTAHSGTFHKFWSFCDSNHHRFTYYSLWIHWFLSDHRS